MVEIKKMLNGYNDNDLDRIFTKYTHNWRTDKSPRPGHFRDWAVESQASKSSEAVAYHKCECEQVYSMNGTGCPSCGSVLTTSILLGSKLTPHIQTQKSCYLCDHYREQDSYGPSCDDWGIKELDWKPCHKCKCFHCCSWEVKFRKDPLSLPIDIAIQLPHELIYKEE